MICLYLRYLFLKTFESLALEKIMSIPKFRNWIFFLLFKIKFFVLVECLMISLDFDDLLNKYLYTCFICLSTVSHSGLAMLNFLKTSYPLHSVSMDGCTNFIFNLSLMLSLISEFLPQLLIFKGIITKSDMESALLMFLPMFSFKPNYSYSYSHEICSICPQTCSRSLIPG